MLAQRFTIHHTCGHVTLAPQVQRCTISSVWHAVNMDHNILYPRTWGTGQPSFARSILGGRPASKGGAGHAGAGYREACEVARRRLEGAAHSHAGNEAGLRKALLDIARTTLSSKILTHDKEHFAQLAVDAVQRLKGSTNLDSIHIIKKAGGTLRVRVAPVPASPQLHSPGEAWLGVSGGAEAAVGAACDRRGMWTAMAGVWQVWLGVCRACGSCLTASGRRLTMIQEPALWLH